MENKEKNYNKIYEDNKDKHFDMYLNLSKSLHSWKRAFYCLFILFTITLIVTLYLSTRSVLIPYVIEVDETGNAKAINPAYQTNYVPTEIQEEYFLKELVRNTITITKDNYINGENYKKNTFYYRGASLNKYKEFIKKEELTKLINTGETRDIKISSINKISELSYQIRWKETFYTKSGMSEGSKNVIGIFKINHKIPKTLKEINYNPLGLIIDDFSLSEEG